MMRRSATMPRTPVVAGSRKVTRSPSPVKQDSEKYVQGTTTRTPRIRPYVRADVIRSAERHLTHTFYDPVTGRDRRVTRSPSPTREERARKTYGQGAPSSSSYHPTAAPRPPMSPAHIKRHVPPRPVLQNPPTGRSEAFGRKSVRTDYGPYFRDLSP